MTGQSSRLARLALWLVLYFATASVWALDPGLPPGGNFDFSHWKLQMPTLGGILTCNTGVDETNSVALEAGFTNAYFYTGTDGAMVFWAPSNGAITSSGSHPRSELRELIQPQNPGNGDTSVNWIPYGTHILNAQCRVVQVSTNAGATKKVIIGQIHAQSSAALPTVKIQYNNGTLSALVKTNSTDDNSDFKFTNAAWNVGLSNLITYQVKLENGLVTIAMNNKTNTFNIFQSDPNYTNETQYFKAGCYNQDDDCSSSSNDGARVAFYAVNLFHAPSITNQPVGQVVTVGSNVTFSVGAAGNPPLKYFWQFNGSPMSGKTNATLSIPNVQLTNAGNYSVIVTDYVGTVNSVVTSSVATLTVNPSPPTANFTATPTNGVGPLNVVFTDTSTGSPTNWGWSFGDAGTSTLQSPSHNYTTAGVYTVRLISGNTGGSSSNTKTAYINVITALQSWSSFYGVPAGTTDADGDGVSNTNEFLTSFNPTDAAAYAHIINIAGPGNDMNITYLGANGDTTYAGGPSSRTNVLEYAVGTTDGSYTNSFVSAGVSQILSNGTGSGIITNVVDLGGATNTPSRYYRIRVLAP